LRIDAKINKYKQAGVPEIVQPIVVEATGKWDVTALMIFKKCASLIGNGSNRGTGITEEFSRLMTRMSCVLQRFNAKMLANCFGQAL